MRQLLDDENTSVVLVAAPPGYGKTSTLAEWGECDERPFAWITLCESDNDPQRLLASLTAATEQLQAPHRRFALERSSPGSVASVLPTLTDALGVTSAGAVLVLDDVEHLHSRESLDLLAELVGAMPAGAKLALASRTVPVLPLARLRAQRELLVLGVRELAMTTDEAGALLAGAGLDLAPDQLERAVARTEGWPVALYLMALALREETDMECALAGFSGDDELVSQYIREELLAQMPPDALTFLMDTSILEELSPELCDVVLARTGSGLALRAVAGANLLVAPLDRGHTRYRCSALLREVLHAELLRRDGDHAARLNLAAARWFAERGDVEQALQHACAGGDLASVGRVLWAQAPRALLQGSGTCLELALSSSSAEQTASAPTLALAAAHRSLCNGDLRRAAHWTQIASSAHGPDSKPDAIPGFAAGLAVIESAVGERGLEHVSAAAKRGYELAEENSPWRPASCLLRGISDRLKGESARAREMLGEGARRGAIVSSGIQSHCLAQLAVMAGEEQDWDSAADLVARAGEALHAARLEDRPTSALVFASSAWIGSQRGRSDEAKRDLARSLHLLTALKDFIPWYEIETRVLIARTAIRLADVPLARTQLSQASRLARRTPDVAVFRVWFDDAWGRLDGLSAAALDGPSSLTMAELRILRFLPTHLSFREIGGRLHVSTNTVKSQVHAVYRKLDAASRSEAVEHASSLGLIDVCI
ncbi:MAG TPA: LuxR C-terminal-related transcriptional regulator [Solirubrobacteraceae bacterium]|nr:LuxR C-terminal-related transcriptional regulator [Solirubrobacteraceae bacterium]